MEIVALNLADDKTVAACHAVNEELGYTVRGQYRSADLRVTSVG